jgi:DNA polymerase-3 subunit epsilon
MVRQAPRFGEILGEVQRWLRGADLAGYNIARYDIPVIAQEFARERQSFPDDGTRVIDAFEIFRVREPRSLAGAYKFYCGKTLEGAHAADVDALAALDVFRAQLTSYADLGPTVDDLHALVKTAKIVDPAGKFVYGEGGQVVFGFGKHRGKPAIEHRDYLEWMLGGDFPPQTKVIIAQLLEPSPGAANGASHDGNNLKER